MRRVVIMLLAVLAMAGLFAQPTPAPAPNTTLALSKSLIAIKVTDLEKQATAFAPLLQMVDQLIMQAPKKDGAPQKTATAGMNELIANVKQVPGLNVKGDIWFAFLPPAPKDDAAPADDAAMTMPSMPAYMLLPLADPQAFNAFLALEAAKPDGMKGVVIGNNGLIALNKAPLDVKAIQLDLNLLTKRDIALSLQISELKLTQLSDAMPPMAMMFLGPVMKALEEQQKNFLRAEIGLAMVGNDLSFEGFGVPVPNSTLAKSLTQPQNTALPVELAGYLPEDVVYCGSSTTMLKGAPGAGYTLLDLTYNLGAMFLPPDKAKPLSTALRNVMAQCSQGRVIGVAPAPAGSAGYGPSVIAVYRVADLAAGKNAMRGFVREMTNLFKMLGEGGGPKLTFTTDAEKVGDLPVDVLRIVTPQASPATKGAPAKPPQPAPKPVTVEVRFSYLNTFMLVTAGGGSKEQMTALIARVGQKKAAYTNTEHFKSLANIVPPTARGFETYAPLDIIKLGVGFMPDGQDKKDAQKKLATYGAHVSVISTFQEVKNNALYGEMRIPGEQLQFIFAALTDLAKQEAAKPKPQPRPLK